MSSKFDGLQVSIPGVPTFLLDSGPATNAWHRNNGLTPSVEPWESQVFVRLLTDRPKFLDIGANMGWYSLIASAATRNAAIVHSFEPEPTNLKLLHGNMSANGCGNVTVWPVALGATDAKMKLFLSENNAGDHRLGADEGRNSIDVDVKRLDGLRELADFAPDLVKIDVQGAEVMVMDGASQIFARGGDKLALLIEFQPEALGMANALRLVEILEDMRRPMFDLYPHEGGRLRPLSATVLRESLEGCLHPKYDSHIDILVAPFDYRFDALRPLIGEDFVQWTVDA